MNKSVAVVILNWNGKDLLKKYLQNVVDNSKEAEVIVADNGSNDSSVRFLQENFPQVRLILLDKNYGFTGGYNKALQEVKSDYYILLNSDVEVTKNWITPIISFMESDEKIAICQPKLLSYTNKNEFEYAGAAGGYIDYLGYPFCAGRIFQHLEHDIGQYNKPREVFWASGAAMFIKSDIFHKEGGLDEDFFAHMEEIDLCWRVKNKGYKVFYCPFSTVYHLGGGTLNKISPKKTYLNFRNNLLLLYKNLPKKDYRKVMFLRFILDFIAAFVFLLTSSKAECKAVFQARRDFNKMKDKFKEKRQKDITSYPSQVYKKSIVITSKLNHKTSFLDIENKLQ
jgi:GT2 family glycosyltransferase